MEKKNIVEVKLKPSEIKEAIKYYLKHKENIDVDVIEFKNEEKYVSGDQFGSNYDRIFVGAICTKTTNMMRN